MGYKVNGITYNYDSSINQRIKGEFVNRGVLACISDMAEHLFGWYDKCFALYDDFENFYKPICPECGSSYGFEKGENDDGETVWTCENCEHKMSDDEHDCLDTEPQEVYEWWIVSTWFGEKLRDAGEVVLERSLGYIWGRCCSGQAILLDYVVSKICDEMGILEGQEHDWSKLV